MLIEYALTPELFDEAPNGDDPTWRERLRQFGRALFPAQIARTAVISNLYDGTWLHQFGQTIDAARHPASADLLRRLRSQIEDACVTRPARGDYPGGEAGWIASARQFDSDAPIDRLVTSDAYASINANEDRCHGLGKTQEDAFWNGSGPTRHPAMVLQDQIDALVPICLHSKFLAFGSPQVRFGGSGDFDFVVALVRRFETKPNDFGPPVLFDIHTKGDPIQGPRNQTAQRLIDEIARLVPVRRAVVRLFLWPSLLERVLMSGDLSAATENPRPRTRWGVSFTHVCRPAIDGPNADRPTWTVLMPPEVARWRARLYGAPGRDAGESPTYSGDSPFAESPIVLRPSV